MVGRERQSELSKTPACLQRLGALGPKGVTPTVPDDNGRVFTNRRFRAACRDCRRSREFITP